ncbi:hypothetical protein Aduo_000362 [Ancylostoma duodenale]
MGTITIIFLLVMYIIGAVSGGTAFGVSHSSQQKQKGKDRDGSLKVIKYYFEDGINQTMKELFLKAAEAWENYTCIKFEEDRSAWDAIIVEGKEGGDCSYTGKPGEPQWLSVGCGYFSGAAHEIGHALGLFHTHSRYDRNAYVYVNWTNVKFYEKEYGKALTKETDHHGVPYDYGSIMHYGTNETNPPLISTDVNYTRTMGSQFISFIDLLEVNICHHCNATCSPVRSVNCKNNGFPNPKDCNICVCPRGYVGQSCDDEPHGQVLEARDTWQAMNESISSYENSTDSYVIRTTWIRSPPNTSIEVEVDSISEGLQAYGCAKAGVEIKTRDDQRLTGYRFCSKSDNGILLKSNLTRIPIITYSMTTAPFNVTLKYHFGKSSQNIILVQL